MRPAPKELITFADVWRETRGWLRDKMIELAERIGGDQ